MRLRLPHQQTQHTPTHTCPPEHYRAKYAVDAAAYVDEMASVLSAAAPPRLHMLAGANTDSGAAFEAPPFEGREAFAIDTEALFPALTEARARARWLALPPRAHLRA